MTELRTLEIDEKTGTITAYKDIVKKQTLARRILKNISMVADAKGISRPALEKEIGLSAGYFSKLGRENNRTVPSVDVLSAVADKLEVTLDFLVNAKIGDGSEKETLILKTIDKLSKDTEEGKVKWNYEKPEDFVGDGLIMRRHPLMKAPKRSAIPIGSVYYSQFGERNQATITNVCYNAELPHTSTTIYLMSISTTETGFYDGSEYDNTIDCIEACLVDGGEVEPLCRTDLESENVRRAVNTLYYMIQQDLSGNNLSRKAKSLLEGYISY